MFYRKILPITLTSSFFLGGTFLGIPTGVDLVKSSFFKKQDMTINEEIMEYVGAGVTFAASYIMMGGATMIAVVGSPIFVPMYIYCKSDGDFDL